MKIRLPVLLVTVIALQAIVPGLTAQTTNTPAPPGDATTFFNSVLGYFSGFNPELEKSLAEKPGSLWTAADWQGGAHVSSSLGLEYRVWKKIGLESETKFADVSGTVWSQQIGANLSLDVHDVRISGGIDAVREFGNGDEDARTYAAFTIRARKMLTVNTFALTGIQVPVESGSKPMFQLGVGFLF